MPAEHEEGANAVARAAACAEDAGRGRAARGVGRRLAGEARPGEGFRGPAGAASPILSSTAMVGSQYLIGLSGRLLPGADAAHLGMQAWATVPPRCWRSPGWRSWCRY